MRASSLLAPAGAVLAVFVIRGGFAEAAHRSPAQGCDIVAEPPVLYGKVVLPLSSIECDGERRRLRIFTTLTRDGAEAAADRRDCRNASICHLDVDAAAPDTPEDQAWCTQAKGFVDGRFIGEATACESDAAF